MTEHKLATGRYLPSFKSSPDGRVSSRAYLDLNPESLQRAEAFATGIEEYLFAWELFFSGHNVFFALSMALELTLRRACYELAQKDYENGQQSLADATTIWLGLGVAYTMAGAFTETAYKKGIRQYMLDGFTGRASREYSRLMESFQALNACIREAPEDVQKSFQSVRDAYMEAEGCHLKVIQKLVPEGASLFEQMLKKLGVKPHEYKINDAEYNEYDLWFKIPRASVSDSEIVLGLLETMSQGLVICQRLHLHPDEIFTYMVSISVAARSLTKKQ